MDRELIAGERLADNIIHWIGVSAGLIACAAMLVAAVTWLPAGSTASLTIYGLAMVAMFGCSAAYHMVPTERWKGLLQRLDHAAIFLKIAGTYTPFAAVKMGGLPGFGLLTVVWTVALGGAAAKLLLASRWDKIAIPLYLVLGWTGIVMFGPLSQSVETITLVLLGAGGALYSIGVIFHVWRSLPYQNAIWHAFVLIATACHFGAVTTAIFATSA